MTNTHRPCMLRQDMRRNNQHLCRACDAASNVPKQRLFAYHDTAPMPLYSTLRSVPALLQGATPLDGARLAGHGRAGVFGGFLPAAAAAAAAAEAGITSKKRAWTGWTKFGQSTVRHRHGTATRHGAARPSVGDVVKLENNGLQRRCDVHVRSALNSRSVGAALD